MIETESERDAVKESKSFRQLAFIWVLTLAYTHLATNNGRPTEEYTYKPNLNIHALQSIFFELQNTRIKQKSIESQSPTVLCDSIFNQS